MAIHRPQSAAMDCRATLAMTSVNYWYFCNFLLPKWIARINVQLCAASNAHQGVSPMQPATVRAQPKPHSHQYPGPRTPVAANPKPYNPRHPEHEQTLLYRTGAGNFETWLELASAGQFDGQGDHHTPPAYVEQAFRKYLECGIFAHGLARARCEDCGHDFFVAFSCKGRGVCPSCNTRRMAETDGALLH